MELRRIVLLVCAIAAPMTVSAYEAKRVSPLGECLVAGDLVEWGVVDDKRLVVKSRGKRYYDIQLTHACPDLDRRPYLAFRGGLRPVSQGAMKADHGSDPVTPERRICGDLGDAVIPMGGRGAAPGLPCDIKVMRRIDEATYKQVFEREPQGAVRILDGAQESTPKVKSD